MNKKHKTAVVFVHGLAKKPPPEKLEEIWLWALGRGGPKPEVFGTDNPGIDLEDQGMPFTFTYWADVFYGTHYETDVRDQYEKASDPQLTTEDLESVAGSLRFPVAETTRELRFLAGFEQELSRNDVTEAVASEEAASSFAPHAKAPGEFEIASWLPRPVKKAIIRMAAMEAYYYLFNKEYERFDGERFHVRNELRNRLLRDLAAASESAERVIIVAHSMGTIIAYDVLRNVDSCPTVDSLITLGSPLGITEVQDELIARNSETIDFPSSKLSRWINVFDPLDPICGLDPRFANDYRPVDGRSVEDVEESNWGNWRHTATHYLAGIKFRTLFASATGINLR